MKGLSIHPRKYFGHWRKLLGLGHGEVYKKSRILVKTVSICNICTKKCTQFPDFLFNCLKLSIL
jgi:hypothetical protein